MHKTGNYAAIRSPNWSTYSSSWISVFWIRYQHLSSLDLNSGLSHIAPIPFIVHPSPYFRFNDDNHLKFCLSNFICLVCRPLNKPQPKLWDIFFRHIKLSSGRNWLSAILLSFIFIQFLMGITTAIIATVIKVWVKSFALFVRASRLLIPSTSRFLTICGKFVLSWSFGWVFRQLPTLHLLQHSSPIWDRRKPVRARRTPY